MIEYTSEFKTEVSKLYKGEQLIELIYAIEGKLTNTVRVLLSDGCDDLSLFKPVYNNKKRYMYRKVCPHKQEIYDGRVRLFSTFMNQYIKEYDRVNRRR